MLSTWPFQFVYCRSHIFITCAFMVSKYEVWECGCIYGLELKSKNWNMWGHTHFKTPSLYFLTNPHVHHTHFLAYHFWFACYRPSWLQVAIILTYIWNMHKMAYYIGFAMYSWGRSSPIINCTFSKCDVHECSHVGRTEKESKHFVHYHAHFLTRLRTHYTHILSDHFDMHIIGLVDLESL